MTGVSVQTKLAENLIQGDRVQLQQAMLNLIINVPERGVTCPGDRL
jgi:hypothetical protein